MTSVKGIKKNRFPFSKEFVELCEEKNVHTLLPKSVPVELYFELHNTCTELANAIRRAYKELNVFKLTIEGEFFTDDEFIILEHLKKRIGLIPIRQIKGTALSIDIYNNADTIIPVFSHMLVDNLKNNDEEFMAPGINITDLRPGKTLKMNLGVVSGSNDASFSFPGNIQYSAINPSKSSMEKDCTSYSITIPRQKYIDPINIVKMIMENLINRLNKIDKIVKINKENFYSSEMEIIYGENKGTFKIINETYTIGNLITKYGFIVDNTIKNIHCIKPHPSSKEITIEIHHKNPQKIIVDAIDYVKKEINTISKSF